ncbi:fructosamine-3-kinase [Streptomyces sp. Amel2xB2]|uniref:fructosamine kinase family protein n=1 Tax=Streptomyces sp. Amel2xB2 TaxID=1305829 RepID=UPI000DBA3543|nr:fructosamine kinase family protein [Streptomyces sp. Amel2xB2]RAJ66468.1 fructosamine-3-kinase [Streptomyces sp. Amel2xB2]
MPALADRVAELTGADEATRVFHVEGGDICDAWSIMLRGGRHGLHRKVFAKTLTASPPGFFAAEAAGLTLLAVTGTVAVPDVLAVEEDVLVLEWLEPGEATPAQAEQLGRDLAALHGTSALSYGTPGRSAYIGPLPLPSPAAEITDPAQWPAFHAEYRLLPYLRQAVDGGGIEPADARDVELLCERLGEFAGPPQPPALIHGDLWSGNVHWSADGSRPYLIDPAAQGGHPETDLALLRLFGCPQLSRILRAYDEVRPGEGRAERVPLHQLHHLLVHAVLFGGGYGARCGAAARAALGQG